MTRLDLGRAPNCFRCGLWYLEVQACRGLVEHVSSQSIENFVCSASSSQPMQMCRYSLASRSCSGGGLSQPCWRVGCGVSLIHQRYCYRTRSA